MRTTSRNGQSRSGERGFTLIEVMIVVLIIGILLAVGIPTYLSATSKAQNRKVQSDLTALAASALPIVWEGGLSDLHRNDLADDTVIPNVSVRGASAQSRDDTEVSIGITSTELVAAMRSDGGQCYFFRISSAGLITRGTKATSYCSANNTNGTPADGW